MTGSPSKLKLLARAPLALMWWGYVWLRLALTWRRPSHARHLLLVSWDFPPNASTGVHLPTSIARHAARSGWKVSVVCGPGPETASAGGAEFVRALPESVAIHRVSRRIAHERHTHLHPAWLIPDLDGGYLSALAMALTAVAAVERAPPAVVIASGPRFANFVAARWIADAFRARLLLQYRDEWTVNTPGFVSSSPNDRREEERCLARADAVSFVSDGKREVYTAAFPAIDARKFLVTPNGWEPYFHDQVRAGTRHLPARDGAFTLTYTGRCHVSFKPLFDMCDRLLERRTDLAGVLRLVFVGDQVPENRRLIADFAQRRPQVILSLPPTTPVAALEIQRESSALLLVNDYPYGGVIPLKTFEYLRSPQPILVFGRTGGAAKVVEDLGAGLAAAVDDLDAFAAAVSCMMRGDRTWDSPQRQAWCARNNRKVLVEEMLAAVAGPPAAAPVFQPSSEQRAATL